jgi:hypothetical protein
MSGIKQMNGTKPQMPQHVASVYKELLVEQFAEAASARARERPAVAMISAVFRI